MEKKILVVFWIIVLGGCTASIDIVPFYVQKGKISVYDASTNKDTSSQVLSPGIYIEGVVETPTGEKLKDVILECSEYQFGAQPQYVASDSEGKFLFKIQFVSNQVRVVDPEKEFFSTNIVVFGTNLSSIPPVAQVYIHKLGETKVVSLGKRKQEFLVSVPSGGSYTLMNAFTLKKSEFVWISGVYVCKQPTNSTTVIAQNKGSMGSSVVLVYHPTNDCFYRWNSSGAIEELDPVNYDSQRVVTNGIMGLKAMAVWGNDLLLYVDDGLSRGLVRMATNGSIKETKALLWFSLSVKSMVCVGDDLFLLTEKGLERLRQQNGQWMYKERYKVGISPEYVTTDGKFLYVRESVSENCKVWRIEVGYE